jgi:hypothetical protein
MMLVFSLFLSFFERRRRKPVLAHCKKDKGFEHDIPTEKTILWSERWTQTQERKWPLFFLHFHIPIFFHCHYYEIIVTVHIQTHCTKESSLSFQKEQPHNNKKEDKFCHLTHTIHKINTWGCATKKEKKKRKKEAR